MFLQGIRQMRRRLKTIRPCVHAYISIDTPRIQVNPGTENRCLTVIAGFRHGFYSLQHAVFHDQTRYLRLLDGQVLRMFQHLPHLIAVRPFVRLRSQ